MIRRRSTGGYSLVELLVSLALLSMIAVLLAGSLSFGVRVIDRLEGESETASQTGAQLLALRRILGGAEQTRLTPESDLFDVNLGATFDGTPVQLRFMRIADGAGGDARLYLFLLATESDLDGPALTLRQCLPDPQRRLACLGQPVERLRVALQGPLQLSYFGARGADSSFDAFDGSWRTDWRGGTRLPQAVRLRIPHADPSAPQEITVAIRAASSPAEDRP